MGATREYMREYRKRNSEKIEKNRKRKEVEKRIEKRVSEIGEEGVEYERFLINRWFHGPASEGINNTPGDVKILDSFIEEDLRKRGFLKDIPAGEYKHPK